MENEVESFNEERWSPQEIEHATKAYLEMLEEDIAGRQINEKAVNAQLRAGALASRSEGSIEYRMQNISSVLEKMGRAWIAGYKPAGNVGPTNTELIQRFVTEQSSSTTYLPQARKSTLNELVGSAEQLMGVKAVFTPLTSYVLCFGGRGSVNNSRQYYSLAAGTAKKATEQPFVITIGGGQNVLNEYDGRVVDLVRVSTVYGPTALLLKDPEEIRRLAQWPVAVAVREVWRFASSPRLIEDLGFPDRKILAGAQDGIIRPAQIEQLYAALRDVGVEPARLPASANYYDDGTPRLFMTKLPNLPAGAREEGKRIWVLQSRTERDGALSADAKRLNAIKYGRFTCEACAVSNSDSSMFDAHHPTPLAVGVRTTFAEQLEVLCPTCHRKAHRTKDPLRPLTLNELKEWHARGRD